MPSPEARAAALRVSLPEEPEGVLLLVGLSEGKHQYDSIGAKNPTERWPSQDSWAVLAVQDSSTTRGQDNLHWLDFEAVGR